MLSIGPALAGSGPGLPAGTEPGDLIFRKGTEAVSAAVMMLDQGGFSHVGMLIGGPGQWQVVHAVPAEIEGRADAVVLDSLAFFTAPERSERHAIYHVNAGHSQRERAVQAAWQMLGRPFRIAGDDAGDGLYCTELIYLAWMEAGIDLDVRFRTLRIPLLASRQYLLPAQLMASPKLQRLPPVAAPDASCAREKGSGCLR